MRREEMGEIYRRYLATTEVSCRDPFFVHVTHSHLQGGRLKSVRSLLVKKGIIESVTMADVSPEFADTKVARLKAHRLLKPYEEDRLGGEEGMEEEEEEEGDVGRCGGGEGSAA